MVEWWRDRGGVMADSVEWRRDSREIRALVNVEVTRMETGLAASKLF